jgi:signal transduction histidine kinase
VGGVVVARTVTRPVRALVSGVRAVETGDYTHRVSVASTDEFAQLAGAVNHMTATIAEREEALRQSEDRLRHAQKMEAVGRLAGGVAHDFNNLLTMMIGRIELVLDELHSDDGLRRDVLLIQGAAESAATLTRQLLAFGRKQVLQIRLLDINQVVGNFEGMLQHLIGEQVILATRLEGGLRAVRADPGQMEQILVNLVINARDAMPEGGTITIETTTGTMPGTDAPCTVIAVHDTGTGMTPDVQARVFEPFFTTKDAGKGTGLGLATVYGIVKQHDGEVELESAPGHGSTFRVFLPYASGSEVAARVRELRPDIKIIYMSGYTHDMVERHGVFEPGTAFLQKPFSARALARTVHDVLAGV